MIDPALLTEQRSGCGEGAGRKSNAWTEEQNVDGKEKHTQKKKTGQMQTGNIAQRARRLRGGGFIGPIADEQSGAVQQ
ncbi:hypothetical protein MRO95_07080 [Dickeya dianthicola]|uniref:hypothetical protein n=1 Tax=Dickeya dianthicola TaxID=204039 RepID=UPI001F6073E6|nr:hypothetical protein [Dickeya dianthicola]MCI4205422.1 hypothetical protein [Dickeya dianthicola]MCI4211290.1 hypothetical protein [Dickeya dianthicola]